MATQGYRGKLADAISGKWRVVYNEIEGQMTSAAHFSTIKMTLKDGRFEIESDGKINHSGTYKVTESSSSAPSKITYIYEKSSSYPTGVPRKGIIQLTGDTMKYSAGEAGKAAPRSFNTAVNSATLLAIYQRPVAIAGLQRAVRPNLRVIEW